MSTDSTNRDSPPRPRAHALAFLSALLGGLIPAIVFAVLTPDRSEHYEWMQFGLAGASCAGSFLLAFLRGHWTENLISSLAGMAAGAIITAYAWRWGLTDFHPLVVLGGAIVALGYWWSQRHARASLADVFLTGTGTILALWAVTRLSWWQPFSSTLASWPNRLWFLGSIGFLTWLLVKITHSGHVSHKRWLSYFIDLLVLVCLAVVIVRTNDLDIGLLSHHWSVYSAPADMVREGHWLLSQVPSQYGFLSTLTLALLPTGDRFTALFYLNSVLAWTAGAIIYGSLRAWQVRWWWQLGAGLIVISCVGFLSGDAQWLSGPLNYPSVGAMRFIWVCAILGFLRRQLGAGAFNNRSLWIGSMLWLLGVLWSVESAVYVTAAWFPAATLMVLPPLAGKSWWIRLHHLFTAIARALVIPGILLGTALVMIGGYYRLGLSRWPDTIAYIEYAVAFSDGFGALPIAPDGAVWVLLLLHTLLISLIVGANSDRERHSIALCFSAWGALWTVSTYYISRSHGNNLTAICPVLLLIVGVAVNAWHSTNRRNLATPWIWITVAPFVSSMLWLVASHDTLFKREWQNYACEPHIARLLPPIPDGQKDLIKVCQQLQHGKYSILGQSSNNVEQAETISAHTDWLPVRSMPLYTPLPLERRSAYLDCYNNGHDPGWLLFPLNADRWDLNWLFDYINSRFTAQFTVESSGWKACYFVPKGVEPTLTPLSLDGTNLRGNMLDGRFVHMMLPPSSISWPLQGTERELVLEVGYDPRAYLEGQSNGTLFAVEITSPSGVTYSVYKRLLDPGQCTLDRGATKLQIVLPPTPAGSQLTLKTTPGANGDDRWDWAYLASAAVLRQTAFLPWQFPGFNRMPEEARGEVAFHMIESSTMVLVMHAPSALRYRLKGDERAMSMDFGLSAGAYQNGGSTDGARYQVALHLPDHTQTTIYSRLLQPVSNPKDRGKQHMQIALPATIQEGTELIVSIDAGPNGSTAFDWTYVANLEFK